MAVFFFFLPEMEILKAFGGEDLQGGSLEKSQARSTSSCSENNPGGWRRQLMLSSPGDEELLSDCCMS